MAGDGLGQIRILQPMAVIHIRRVGGHHIKRSLAEQPAGFPDVSLYDVYLLFQPVQPDAPGRHLGHLLLDLQAGKMPPFGLGLQKDRDDAGPRAQIHGPLSFPHPGKPG